jgi:hypothetical protein
MKLITFFIIQYSAYINYLTVKHLLNPYNLVINRPQKQLKFTFHGWVVKLTCFLQHISKVHILSHITRCLGNRISLEASWWNYNHCRSFMLQYFREWNSHYVYDIALHLFLRSEARANTKAAILSSTGNTQHYSFKLG